MAFTMNPWNMDPKEFAKICGVLIGVFFIIILVSGVSSTTGRRKFARRCCYFSIAYFAISTAYIMIGMVISFEVARRKFDR